MSYNKELYASVNKRLDEVEKLYDECMRQNDFDKAIRFADVLCEVADKYEDIDCSFYYKMKGKALFYKGCTFKWNIDKMPKEECEKKRESRNYYCNLAYNYFCKAFDRSNDPVFQMWKGLVKQCGTVPRDYYLARRFFIAAMASDDIEIKEMSRDWYEKNTKEFLRLSNEFCSDEYKKTLSSQTSEEERKKMMMNVENNKFTNKIPIHNRQFIFFVKNESQIAGCYDLSDNIQWVFTLDGMPADIQIEGGTVEANVLYMAHPHKKSVYVQYEKSEDIFFMERVREFAYLCQCLGAEQISFRTIRGKLMSEQDKSHYSGHIDGEKVKVVGGSLDASYNGSLKSKYGSQEQKEITQVFEPTRKPYCPDGLFWLDSDSSWKLLVRQRLEENILSYTYRIKSSDTISVSQNTKFELKASFKYMMVKVNANFQSEIERTFDKQEETEWEISVKFKDCSLIDKLQSTKGDSHNNSLSGNERSFLEEVRFCYEDDNNISDEERVFLERKRVKLNITPERAEQIIAMVQPQLTEEETEYLELFKEMVSQPDDISPRIRSLLDREAKSLGISPDRKEALEKSMQ